MFWDTNNSDVCQCSSVMKRGFTFTTEQCCHSCQNEPDESYMDKENIQQRLGSPMKQDSDLSLYENTNSLQTNCDGSPMHCTHQPKIRRSLEDHDNNSQDSGYGASCPSEGGKFFSQKSSVLSFGSPESIDVDFVFIDGLENDDENAQLPGDFNKLITGSLLTKEEKKPAEYYSRPTPFRRSISFNADGSTPNTGSSRVRSCLFKQTEDSDVRSFKRPEPPTESHSPLNTKRSKVFGDENRSKPRLVRCISATEDSIKSALQRSSNEPDLIGDFSKSFCLPLISGRHQDLKSISPNTLALLMQGHFKNNVDWYKVIDCRYPYEYNGGHITGAVNIYTKQQILDELLNLKVKNNLPLQDSTNHKRHILIFHCEFSSERGPNLSRFLRQVDRTHNEDSYPFLHYPEIYLLDGGYKSFYEQYSQLCNPEGYLPMLDPNYESDLREFRAKSRSFNADSRSKSNMRASYYKRV